jgi:undecaprenyl-diphosphatase
MSFLETLVLAIVQGLTEFLPVSSSGHLVIANALLESLGSPPTQDLLEVSIALHMGTLLSVIVYYWKEILRLLGSDRRVIPMLLLASVPAGIVGVGIKKGLSDSQTAVVMDNVLLVGCMLPITAWLLWSASKRAAGGTRYQDISARQAVSIGFAQAIAILPGISRSGSTIAAGLRAGLDREGAATFSFLMSIPVIAGAGLLEGLEVIEAGASGTAPAVLAVGFAASFVVGLAALALLIRFVKRGQLGLFAYYLVPLGAAVVAWQLAR